MSVFVIHVVGRASRLQLLLNQPANLWIIIINASCLSTPASQPFIAVSARLQTLPLITCEPSFRSINSDEFLQLLCFLKTVPGGGSRVHEGPLPKLSTSSGD